MATKPRNEPDDFHTRLGSMKRILISTSAALAVITSASAVTITWDFEGATGTRFDTSGTIEFTSTVDPVANDTAWAVGATGETNAVNYAGLATINGEHNNRAAGNDWFLRSDHAYEGGTLTKPGDGRTGTLRSGSFL